MIHVDGHEYNLGNNSLKRLLWLIYIYSSLTDYDEPKIDLIPRFFVIEFLSIYFDLLGIPAIKDSFFYCFVYTLINYFNVIEADPQLMSIDLFYFESFIVIIN